MRILFIHSSIGSSDPPRFVLGIASIASVLEQHNHVCNLISIDSWDLVPAVYNRINSFKPDVIGFSSTATTFESVRRLSKLIKKRYPSLQLVCGGVHTTLCPEDFNTCNYLDAICRGDGEFALLDYLKRLESRDGSHLLTPGFWTRKGKRIYKNPLREPIPDINVLPFPNRDIFLSEHRLWYQEINKFRVLEFIFTRGCPFMCAYCSNHALNKFYNNRNLRFMKPERAIAEIQDALEKYACEEVYIDDDTFTLNPKWMEDFLRLYKKNIHVPFICNTRADQITKKLLQRMKDAGCVMVCFGIDCGDESLSLNLLKRRMTNKQIINAFTLAKEVGLKTYSFVMIGFPHESPRKFVNTIKLIGKIKPDEYVLSVFYPYPGTELYYLCKKERLIRRRPKNFLERTDTILDIPTFQRKDILYYYKNFEILVELLRVPANNWLVRFHRFILWHLLVRPPTDALFIPFQFVLSIDRGILYWARYITNVYNSFTTAALER